MRLSELDEIGLKLQAIEEQMEEDLADGQIDEDEAKNIMMMIQEAIQATEQEDVEIDEVDLSAIKAQIEEALEDGEIDDQEAEEIMEAFGVVIDEYNGYEPVLISFAEAASETMSEYGKGLLGLGSMLGYEDAAEFISDVAVSMGEPTTYVAEILKGDRMPDPEFSQDLVNMLIQKQAIDESEAEAIFLDLMECDAEDKQIYQLQAKSYGEMDREKYEDPDLDFQSREREYYQAMLDMDDRQRMREQMMKAAMNEEINDMKYSLSEIQSNLEFQQETEQLANAFEDQRVRAEKLVDDGLLTPANYKYYFGDRKTIPDKMALFSAMENKAQFEGTSLISEFNINERVLTDAQEKESSISTNYYGNGRTMANFSEPDRDPTQDPYIQGFLERNFSENVLENAEI